MSYADDNTPHVCSENFDFFQEKQEKAGKILFEWQLLTNAISF